MNQIVFDIPDEILLALKVPPGEAGAALRMAESLGLRLKGTLGLLLDAKREGLIPAIIPLLNQLQELRFRLAPYTRTAVLKLAGEH